MYWSATKELKSVGPVFMKLTIVPSLSSVASGKPPNHVLRW